jgi:hypothetical protein
VSERGRALLLTLLVSCHADADRAYVLLTVRDPNNLASNATDLDIFPGAGATPEAKSLDGKTFPTTLSLSSPEPGTATAVVQAMKGAQRLASGSTTVRFELGRLGSYALDLARTCEQDSDCLARSTFCGGAEVCSAHHCVSAPDTCPPSRFPCVKVACSELDQRCIQTLDPSMCPSGICDPLVGCIAKRCTQDSDCHDENFCAGTCVHGSCARQARPLDPVCERITTCDASGMWSSVPLDDSESCSLPFPPNALGACRAGSCHCPGQPPPPPDQCNVYSTCTSTRGWAVAPNPILAICTDRSTSGVGACVRGDCLRFPLLSLSCPATCGADPTLHPTDLFAQHSGDTLVVEVGWVGAAAVGSVSDIAGDAFVPLVPVRQGMAGSLAVFSARGVKASDVNGLSVQLQGSPDTAYVLLWLLPQEYGRLHTETSSTGVGGANVSITVAFEADPLFFIASCLGCSSLSPSTFGLVATGVNWTGTAIGPLRDSEAYGTLYASLVGGLTCSVAGPSNWVMETMLFGP